MYSNQPYDRVDEVLDGLDRDKIIQAFSILGIPIGEENYNQRGEIIDSLSVDEMNNPVYWNDRKTGVGSIIKEPIYTPEYVEDPNLGVPREPKTDWDIARPELVV